MIRSMRLKKAVAGLLAGGLLSMTACQGDDAPEIVKAAPPIPDVVDDDGTTTGYLYYAGNEYHEQKMETLLANPGVDRAIMYFAAIGFVLSPSSSFTVEGNEGGLAASATFIAMNGTDESAGQSVSLACVESGGEFHIAPAVYSAAPPPGESDWAPVGDGIWTRDVDVGDINLSAQRFDRWSWSYFRDCVTVRIPGIAAGCTVTCLMVPAFWHCFLVCTVSQSVGATVGCIIRTFRYGGTDKKWQ